MSAAWTDSLPRIVQSRGKQTRALGHTVSSLLLHMCVWLSGSPEQMHGASHTSSASFTGPGPPQTEVLPAAVLNQETSLHGWCCRLTKDPERWGVLEGDGASVFYVLTPPWVRRGPGGRSGL